MRCVVHILGQKSRFAANETKQHFDHLPGADIIAKATGAKIIANGEAINVMRRAGVPEEQLIPIAGGEVYQCGAGITVHPQPALHCLPGWSGHEHPEFMDTGKARHQLWKMSSSAVADAHPTLSDRYIWVDGACLP